MSALIVPDTGLELVDGSIVILARFPSTKWIVHHGWYTYSGQQMMGWYFCSIPANTVIPASDADLRMLTIVSNSGSCNCPSNPAPVVPAPPAPGCHPSSPIRGHQAWELDRAFISVNTLAERDLLNKRLLPDGKIVRVGNDGDGPEYYRWNQVTSTWETEHFGLDPQKFLTMEQADALFLKKSDALTQEDLDAVTERVDAMQQQVDAASSTAKAAEDAAKLAQASAENSVEVATDALQAANAAQTAADEARAVSQTAVEDAKKASDEAQDASRLANEVRQSAAKNAEDIKMVNDRVDAVATEVAGLDDEMKSIQDEVGSAKGQIQDLQNNLQSQVDEALRTSTVLTDAVQQAVSAEVTEIDEQLEDINAHIVEIREQIEVQDEWGALPPV